jgi:hypothetical protein
MSSTEKSFPNPTLVRLVVLTLLLMAFARLVWRLDANNLWWDESLSLARAESDWSRLLRGRIDLFDGATITPTTDQHPFGFFVVLGTLVRLTGTSEFVLRFPAVMAATLLAPVLWVWARYGIRHAFLPKPAALIALILAAWNPFYLYYGQEARIYTLLALLALLTTYLLLRWSEAMDRRARRGFLMGYIGVTLFFLTSHYFSVLLLPLHALIFFFKLYQSNRRVAIIVAAALLLIGLGLGLAAAWIILSQPYGGSNFRPISLRILVPDLLNAFSLGLSVNIVQVWWLDLVFGAAALLGAIWGLRRWPTLRAGGWLLPAAILIPIVLLLIINQVQPAYMNARHLALISGFFLLLVAGGVALIWRLHPLLGGMLLALLLGGMLYSTVNHYTRPEYAKDDFTVVGDYLRRELAPGDLLLLNPPDMLRLYQYYLPIDIVEQSAAAGIPIGWRGVPLLQPTQDTLSSIMQGYQRVWVVTSGMFPSIADPKRGVRDWINANTFRIREVGFERTQTFLELDLHLPKPPIIERLPAEAIGVDARFADQVRLLGYKSGQPLTLASAIPITLYWQAAQPLSERYKYLAYLEVSDEKGGIQPLPATEREPYDGFLPTVAWSPEHIIMEHSHVAAPSSPLVDDASATLVIQIYNAANLEKLRIESTAVGDISEDSVSLRLPFRLPRPNLP